MRDLAVIGGGPAGLATALYGARAGLQVTVYEPRPGDIDKACGEGLMPGAVAALADLGVDPAGYRLHGIRYLSGASSAEAFFRTGVGRGVRRTTLHAALMAATRSAGVEIVHEYVTSISQDQTTVSVNGATSRYAVAADGLHSRVRRLLQLERPVRAARRFGLRTHVELAPWTHHVEVHWSRTAEAYVTPVGPDLVGVALLTQSRRPFDEQLGEFTVLHDRLSGRSRSQVRGAGPLRQRSIRRTQGRILLVGDASGYVDALTGEGIALGLAHGRAAVDAIRADDPRQYEHQWRRINWRYQLLTGGLLRASQFAPARRAIVPAAAALPGLFSSTVNVLARPA